MCGFSTQKSKEPVSIIKEIIHETHMAKLTWELYTNARKQVCCASKCKGCPYVKKHEGGHVSDASNSIQPWILEQLSLISIENSPNREFQNYHDKEEVVVRLKNWNQRLRGETESRLRVNIEPAKKEDFLKYYGYLE